MQISVINFKVTLKFQKVRRTFANIEEPLSRARIVRFEMGDSVVRNSEFVEETCAVIEKLECDSIERSHDVGLDTESH